MTTGLKELRSLIEHGRTSGGHLPRAARGVVVDRIEELRAQGQSYREIAEAVGVRFQTLMSWRTQQSSASLVAVHVSAPASGVTVHGPRGLRVDGLSLDELMTLWSRLSS